MDIGGRQLPEFTDQDGTRWIWDSATGSYVQAPVDASPVDRSHAFGGDSNLFDPSQMSEQPSNPMAEGILSSAKCQHCGDRLGENDSCPECRTWAEEFRKHPEQNPQFGPFNDSVPKNNWEQMDQSFPSKITNTPSLDECPECQSPNMRDHGDERVCPECNLRQPIIHMKASMDSEKNAGTLEDLGLGAATLGLGATNLIPGVGEAADAAVGPELAAADAAALGSEAGGAADLGSEAAGAANSAGGAIKNFMGSAMSKGKSALGDVAKFKGMQALVGGVGSLFGGGGGGGGGLPPSSLANQTDNGISQSSVYSHFLRFADDGDAEDSEKSDNIFAYDGTNANPDDPHTQDFMLEYGDDPAEFKDTNGGGGSKGISKQDVQTTFEHTMPLILHYMQSEEDGSNNPVMKALDEMLKEHLEDYDGEDESKDGGNKEDADQPKDKESSLHQSDLLKHDPDEKQTSPCPVCGAMAPCGHRPNVTPAGQPTPAGTAGMPQHTPVVTHITEKIAARKPKMCGFHNDLVDYALTLEDPGKALQSIKPVDYGKAYCKSEGNDTKCNFKPAMVAQSYWDAKDAEADQRRDDREQAAKAEAEAQQAAEHVETEHNELTVSDPALDAEVLDDLDTGYSPTADNQTSAVGLGEPLPAIAASVHTAEFRDTTGKPLETGRTYLLTEQNYAIPDRIKVDSVTPEKLSYTLQTDLMDYQQVMSSHDASTERFTFEPVESDEPAHDSVSDGFGSVEASAPKTVQTQNKTAGRSFSISEQRQLIDEPGLARNAKNLDIADSHYNPADLDAALNGTLDDHIAFGGW